MVRLFISSVSAVIDFITHFSLTDTASIATLELIRGTRRALCVGTRWYCNLVLFYGLDGKIDTKGENSVFVQTIWNVLFLWLIWLWGGQYKNCNFPILFVVFWLFSLISQHICGLSTSSLHRPHSCQMDKSIIQKQPRVSTRRGKKGNKWGRRSCELLS